MNAFLPAELLAQPRREGESASQRAAALTEQLDNAVLAKEAADAHGQTLVQRLCAASNSLLGKCLALLFSAILASFGLTEFLFCFFQVALALWHVPAHRQPPMTWTAQSLL